MRSNTNEDHTSEVKINKPDQSCSKHIFKYLDYI